MDFIACKNEERLKYEVQRNFFPECDCFPGKVDVILKKKRNVLWAESKHGFLK